MHKRKPYLEDIPLNEAVERLHRALEEAGFLKPLPPEEVPLSGASGRVTAKPVWARLSVPHYYASAMDGYAVKSSATTGASETNPLHLNLREQAFPVDTGDLLPQGCDAVIMIEHTQWLNEGAIEISSPVPPWHNVRMIGEDIVSGELILPQNRLLGPVDIGAAAAAGVKTIQVRRKPRVAIIPTGDELVSYTQTPKPGEIIEFNSLMLAGMVEQWGGIANRFSPVPDEEVKILESVDKVVKEHDIIIINAGSSAGSEDYSATVISKLGRVLLHGIAIRPGHPVVIGIVNGKPVFGIPGYPVSAVLTTDILIKPLVYKLLGLMPPAPEKIDAFITRKVVSPMGEDEFLRVRVGKMGDRFIAMPLPRGAGIISSLVKADGMVIIPRFSEGVHRGAKVQVHLLINREAVENSIVITGSHDITIDLLANRIKQINPVISIASTNVGSIGGLMALKQQEAHIAGCHLLDEATGEYNISYIRKMLPDRKIVLLNLVHRQQGLIVAKGNPKEIKGLGDLLRKDISFVNRQQEAGTRVLLDFKLRELGLSPEAISGYERVEFTHLAVASAVAGGSADVGLGILAAAKALDLDFIPVAEERYDMAIPEEVFNSPLLQPLIVTIKSAGFKQDVEASGGYSIRDTGKVIATICPAE